MQRKSIVPVCSQVFVKYLPSIMTAAYYYADQTISYSHKEPCRFVALATTVSRWAFITKVTQ